MNSNNKKKK